MVLNVIERERLPPSVITESCRRLQMSWDDLEPHPSLSENANVTECPGKFKSVGKDFGDRLGSPAHFADGKAEAQRGEERLGMQLTQMDIDKCRCRFSIWVPGLPA